jgi:hypothetical protein
MSLFSLQDFLIGIQGKDSSNILFRRIKLVKPIALVLFVPILTGLYEIFAYIFIVYIGFSIWRTADKSTKGTFSIRFSYIDQNNRNVSFGYKMLPSKKYIKF